MRLTTFTDYSMRVLIYLALHPEDELVTSADIAVAHGISKNHLMKVVHYLGQQGYVETVRGKSGGVRLGMQPEQINLGQLVRGTESSTSLVECFAADSSRCRIEPACALRGILQRALQAFYAVLDGYTLADVMRNRDQLAALLKVA
ncbi:MAG: Rrf2 family transcriptional regulator [Thiohalobacteraceae bacterium]|nr:Rrf2 family transcriptional regulator [Gammaproteobacteria bacterium]